MISQHGLDTAKIETVETQTKQQRQRQRLTTADISVSSREHLQVMPGLPKTKPWDCWKQTKKLKSAHREANTARWL